eukprot:11859123-Alexandrium_andersonii.AAC.1
MSASLVGSEMCIRDRPSPSPIGNFGLAPLFFVDTMAGSLPGQGRAPVSYTHLTLPTICSV